MLIFGDFMKKKLTVNQIKLIFIFINLSMLILMIISMKYIPNIDNKEILTDFDVSMNSLKTMFSIAGIGFFFLHIFEYINNLKFFRNIIKQLFKLQKWCD